MRVRVLFALTAAILVLSACTNGLLTTTAIFNSRYKILLRTWNGLAISSDHGRTFDVRTASNSGLYQDQVVYAVGAGNDVYVAFNSYMGVSNDGGKSFVNYANSVNGIGGAPFDDSVYGGFAQMNGTAFFGSDDCFNVTRDHGATFTHDCSGPWGVVTGFSGTGNFILLNSADATDHGLHISTDGGSTFPIWRTIADGLPDDTIWVSAVSGANVYTGGPLGMGVSNNGGASFTAKTTADGLGTNTIYRIEASGNYVFVATPSGVSVSSNNGFSFTNKTTIDGLPSNNVYDLAYGTDGYLYVVTDNGLAYSTDKGQSFTVVDTSAYFPAINIGGISLQYY